MRLRGIYSMKIMTVMAQTCVQVHTHTHTHTHTLSELHVNVLWGSVVLAERHNLVSSESQESTEDTSCWKRSSSTFSVYIYNKQSNHRMCWCSDIQTELIIIHILIFSSSLLFPVSFWLFIFFHSFVSAVNPLCDVSPSASRSLLLF